MCPNCLINAPNAYIVHYFFSVTQRGVVTLIDFAQNIILTPIVVIDILSLAPRR